MEFKDILLTVLSFLASTFIVVLFIAIGWYIIWVAFLSRFKLLRELFSVGEANEKDKDKATGSVKRKSNSPVSSRRRKGPTAAPR